MHAKYSRMTVLCSASMDNTNKVLGNELLLGHAFYKCEIDR